MIFYGPATATSNLRRIISMTTTQHFSVHPALAAMGLKIRSLKFFEPIEQNVRIFQKSIKHQPVEKLYDAFIAILAGAHGLLEITLACATAHVRANEGQAEVRSNLRNEIDMGELDHA
jgi:hypothetical protein